MGMNIATLVLLFSVSILFGINNGSVCQAGIVGSGLFTFKRASLLVGLGLLLGSLVEGWKTKEFITTYEIPANAEILILTIPLFLLLISTIYGIPMSIAHLLTGAWLGIIMIDAGSIIFNALIVLIIVWVATPIAAIFLSSLLYVILRKIAYKRRLSTIASFNRIALTISSLYTSYVLGSNNIGLLMGVVNAPLYILPTIVLGVLIGSMFMSPKFTKTIGEDFVGMGPLGVLSSLISGSFTVWLATQIGCPASLTNSIMGGIIGAGLISNPSIVNMRKLYQVTLSWALAGLIGFLLSYFPYILFLSTKTS